jgi:hypothetical protein
MVPQGYRRVDGRLVELPRAAPVIRRIFQEYATGKSYRQVANLLNLEGIRPPRDRLPAARATGPGHYGGTY